MAHKLYANANRNLEEILWNWCIVCANLEENIYPHLDFCRNSVLWRFAVLYWMIIAHGMVWRSGQCAVQRRLVEWPRHCRRGPSAIPERVALAVFQALIKYAFCLFWQRHDDRRRCAAIEMMLDPLDLARVTSQQQQCQNSSHFYSSPLRISILPSLSLSVSLSIYISIYPIWKQGIDESVLHKFSFPSPSTVHQSPPLSVPNEWVWFEKWVLELNGLRVFWLLLIEADNANGTIRSIPNKKKFRLQCNGLRTTGLYLSHANSPDCFYFNCLPMRFNASFCRFFFFLFCLRLSDGPICCGGYFLALVCRNKQN